MDVRLFICIPCKDRKAIVEQCLPTMLASRYSGDVVRCYNDGSTSYDAAWLESLGADWAMNFSGMGVDAQRRMHVLDYWEHRDEFSHLYFSDSDAIMDPHWRERLLEIQQRTGCLTCGYHTATHENYEHNVYAHRGDIVMTRFAPGVSYLLSRAHVEKIMAHLPERWDFDWMIPSLLGYRCAVSDMSCVDHIGIGGLHDGEGVDERALNPTFWLQEKRKEIIECLTKS